jgi:nucleoside-diphosphate-sugar epimerase
VRAVDRSDLAEVLAATLPLWEQMRGQRLFLAGGTGFFGTWLLETFLNANRTLSLGAAVTVLSRQVDAFRRKVPHLAKDQALTLLEGDVRSFDFPPGQFSFVIHAATDASAALLAGRPKEMLSTIVDGTDRVLQFAHGAVARKLLFTSSGAVYGRQPSEIAHVSEDYLGAPNPLSPSSAYGEGKRLAEMLCSLAASENLQIKIARCFAFVGPHLPLDTHFAVGNFLSDALAQRPISIAGDGTSVRSYLYATDLATWLWTLLFQAPSLRAYNVGSEVGVGIRELAAAVAATREPALEVSVAGRALPGQLPARYVPSTARAQAELGLRQTVPLQEALRRTLSWHQIESSGNSD